MHEDEPGAGPGEAGSAVVSSCHDHAGNRWEAAEPPFSQIYSTTRTRGDGGLGRLGWGEEDQHIPACPFRFEQTTRWPPWSQWPRLVTDGSVL